MAATRERLVADHLHLVHAIAAKLRGRLARTMEPGDLVGYGTKGLIEAAERFDARQGTPFAIFAHYRIRGAIFDGMRTMGWYSRGDYARFRAEERAGEYLAAAADREGAERRAVPGASSDHAETLASIAELLGGVAAVHITSLEAAREQSDGRFKAPDEALLDAEGAARVRAALARLPDKERRLLTSYYFDDEKLEAAGKKLGLSKSWASRLHARAVAHLRELLEGGNP
ncbi:MAG: sigma-70 family RNA polymerase sigma factor [Deltaproteobacteria bacterium]|jgi:RNA polymerase sigma factor for flagellar operon FliA|nr:sigma-70 family RNA polymerase sigma factor [Deltaproteobacteria bacterium]